MAVETINTHADPDIQHDVDLFGDQLKGPDITESYLRYLAHLGIDAADALSPPPPTYHERGEDPRTYNQDHADAYILPADPSLDEYLRSDKLPGPRDKLGIDTVVDGKPVRYIKGEDLRSAVLQPGEAGRPLSETLIAQRIAGRLYGLTDAGRQVVIVSDVDEILTPSLWEIEFARMTEYTRSVQLDVRASQREDLLRAMQGETLGAKLSIDSPNLLEDAKAYWRSRQLLGLRGIYEREIALGHVEPMTIDYAEMAEAVHEMTGDDHSRFNATWNSLLMAVALMGNTDVYGPEDEVGRYYGFAWENDFITLQDSQRQALHEVGVEALGKVRLINTDVGDAQITDMPEIAARAPGAEHARGRIEEDGTATLVINYSDAFIDYVKKQVAESGNRGFDEVLIEIVTDYLQRYDRVEMWVSSKDFYHPQFCGWSKPLEDVIVQQNIAADAWQEEVAQAEGQIRLVRDYTLKPPKRYEMVVMNRDLTSEMEQIGHERARRLAQTAQDTNKEASDRSSTVRVSIGSLLIRKEFGTTTPEYAKDVGAHQWREAQAA